MLELLGPRFRGDERREGLVLGVLALVCLLLAAVPALAVLPSEMLTDPALEARARALSSELRCMVCQNQSIDDSDAPLAADLRVLLRERISAGDTDEQVRNFLVARYGDFILLNPRLTGLTVLLWAAPLAALVAGGAIVWIGYRRRRSVEVTSLAEGEEEALRRILSDKG